MNAWLILSLIFSYFVLLIGISYWVGGKNSNTIFFSAGKKSPWYIVSFGMIGATLSGVTFISVPGWVEASQFSYMQMVLGYILGYFIIGTILLPLYYRLNLVSIYSYLEGRFGFYSYKTGATFFIISRVIGASFRLFLVANVLQLLVFDSLNIPFWITVIVTILLIWVYTFRSGIKTIVWTDSLQTLCMLLAVGVCVYEISTLMNYNWQDITHQVIYNEKARIFFFDNPNSAQYFWKQFFSGAFIAIVMTGLDQDMMQKNLTCRSLKDAQKNMFWFTIVLTFVNLVFLILGYLLTEYAINNNINAEKDMLFATIATLPEMSFLVGILFILGLIAAAYSSADSALTSLTTSVCIDLLDIKKEKKKERQIKIRKQTHQLLSVGLVLVILIFKYVIADKSVISQLFLFAGYTYGPLLGLYSFGLFTKWQVKDKLVPIICIVAPIFSYLISIFSKTYIGFDFGFFILILNGFLTFLGLVLIHRKQN